MGALTKTLYDTDFVEWAQHTAETIRCGRLDEVDLEHVAEEIADLGNSEKASVESQLSRLLMHLTKLRIQPERAGSSWRHSIVDARRKITIRLKHSPSLRRFLEESLQETYDTAVKDALEETNLMGRADEFSIPKNCPYTLQEMLDADLDSLWPR
jgi:hypothetical protein